MSTNEAPAKTYKLFAAKRDCNYHIMKINNPHQPIDLSALPPPLSMSRRKSDQLLMQDDADQPEIKVGGEKYDPSKVAGATPQPRKSMFKKKHKTSFFGREEGYDHNDPDDGIRGLKKQAADPDAVPYVLTTGDSGEFEGKVEGAQSSSYVLFVLKKDGFDVIPASKWYTFKQKKTYHTLSIDEAEERLKVRGGLKSSDRWLMHAKKSKDDPSDPADEERLTSGGPVKSIIQTLRVTDSNDAGPSPNRKGRRARDELAEELDFEEDFQDDDGMMDLGIEDEEDRKEATSRTFGGARTKSRINFDEDDDDEPHRKGGASRGTKKLKKTLEKIEKKDLWDSDEDKDPYATDESSDDEELDRLISGKDKEVEVKTEAAVPGAPTERQTSLPPNPLKRKPEANTADGAASSPALFMKKQKRSEIPSKPPSDSLKASPRQQSPRQPSTSPPPATISSDGKIRIKLTVRSTGPPPPPTAAQVIAAENLKIRARRATKRSQSMSPQAPTSSYSPNQSPSPNASGGLASTAGDSDEFVRILNGCVCILKEAGELPVVELVKRIKPLLREGDAAAAGGMKALLKGILKRVAVHDKVKGVMMLNEAYK